MQYRFAKPYMEKREVEKNRKRIDEFGLLADPAYYPFGAGNPSPDTFPVEAFREISQRIFSDPALTAAALNYGDVLGYGPLREQTVQWNNDKYPGLAKAEDEIMMVHGGLHGLSLPATVLLEEGDVVLVEDPCFGPSRTLFRLRGAQVIGVPMETDGMDLGALEQALQQYPNTKMIYTVSAFQNPTGYTLSMEKRKQLYEMACRYDVLLLEDNPYGELRYSGEPLPPLKCLDTEGRVIYSGSYSKILSPGLRLGYTIANQEIIGKMCKARDDVHTGMLQQLIASEYIREYDFLGHIQENCVYYREKRDLMVESLERNLPAPATCVSPDGGIFLWIDLPSECDSVDVMNCLLDRKVLVCDSNRYLLNRNRQGLRLNFSMPSREKITEGIPILCDTLRELLLRSGNPARETAQSAF